MPKKTTMKYLEECHDYGFMQIISRFGIKINGKYVWHPSFLLYIGALVSVEDTSVWYKGTLIHTF